MQMLDSRDVQLSSSVKSAQSSTPLHTEDIGTQLLLPHMNAPPSQLPSTHASSMTDRKHLVSWLTSEANSKRDELVGLVDL